MLLLDLNHSLLVAAPSSILVCTSILEETIYRCFTNCHLQADRCIIWHYISWMLWLSTVTYWSIMEEIASISYYSDEWIIYVFESLNCLLCNYIILLTSPLTEIRVYIFFSLFCTFSCLLFQSCNCNHIIDVYAIP